MSECKVMEYDGAYWCSVHRIEWGAIWNPRTCVAMDAKDKQIAELTQQLEHMREALKRLEWWIERGHDNVVGVATVSHYCLICGGCQEDTDGHDEDCWLAATIGEDTK